MLCNIFFCYIANILLHNRNLFDYIAFNLMLYHICHMLHNIYCYVIYIYI